MSIAKFATAIAIVGASPTAGLTAGLVASAATMPQKGGAIEVFVTPSETANGGGTILIVGAIADHGRTSKAKAKGIGTATMTKGTLDLDLSKLNAAANNASPSMMNNTTCSFAFRSSAPVTIVSGTGAYAGAHGTVLIHEVFSLILPRLANGKCNEANSAVPVAQYGSVEGSGTISF
jgi:hypothetical protein